MSKKDECPGCGSSEPDRIRYRDQNSDSDISLALWSCPHCGSLKCCMCDMGDDTDCISCDEATE